MALSPSDRSLASTCTNRATASIAYRVFAAADPVAPVDAVAPPGATLARTSIVRTMFRAIVFLDGPATSASLLPSPSVCLLALEP